MVEFRYITHIIRGHCNRALAFDTSMAPDLCSFEFMIKSQNGPVQTTDIPDNRWR